MRNVYIHENIELIRKTLNSIKNASKVVELLAITKGFCYRDVSVALKYGIKHVGENRIQEAIPKFKQLNLLNGGITKHFVGHLQSNKVRIAVENFDLIHSLDSIDLAYAIGRYASSMKKVQSCLIEVKVDKKITKTGVNPKEVKDFYKKCFLIQNILIKGLMVVAPYSDNPEDSRLYFKQVYNLFDDIRKSFGNSEFIILSMGMSGDYVVAVEEGANMVRLGSAIFGERCYTTK
jgi:pyridoxal phosphate enzyme (YggS family)